MELLVGLFEGRMLYTLFLLYGTYMEGVWALTGLPPKAEIGCMGQSNEFDFLMN